MGTRGIKALAVAASLAAIGWAGHAAAGTNITVTDVEMYQGYTAHIGGEDAYTNIMRFTAVTNPGGVNVPDLYGFCIDIYHNIGLGGQSLPFLDTQGDLGNLLTTNFGPTSPANILTNSGPVNDPLNPLNQISAITNLVDTGFKLYTAGTPTDDVWAREAAIQAAIWQIENPNVAVSVDQGGVVQQYFTDYSTGNYSSLADGNDKVFTILSQNGSQSFAIGWPIGGVPEPTTWGLMLTGFFGLGSMLRRQRKAAAATA